MQESIMIVDDDNELRQELKSSLDEYNVVEAKDGQEALRLLNRPNEVDLVLLDVKMPGLYGTEILKLIKKKESRPGVIMLTAFSSKDVAIDALRGQADDFLEKPVDIDKLRFVIEKYLETRKYNTRPVNGSGLEQKVERVKRYVERNSLKKVTLDDAAIVVGLSPKYLSRAFRQTAGEGFLDYRLKVKIEKAKEFLENTALSISEISDRIGFMNPESFMRIFKKITGKTPTKYRKSKK